MVLCIWRLLIYLFVNGNEVERLLRVNVRWTANVGKRALTLYQYENHWKILNLEIQFISYEQAHVMCLYQ